MKRTPSAPAHLSATTRSWWRAIVKDFDLQPHHLRLLQAAGEAWDRMVQAREVLSREGLTVESRQGVKPHPCVAIERDSRIGFARMVKDLGLDIEPPIGGR